jgi:hypothetical protein
MLAPKSLTERELCHRATPEKEAGSAVTPCQLETGQ